MRTITLTDSDGAIVSILELPEHASEAQTDRIVNGAAILCDVRGFSMAYVDSTHSRRPYTYRGSRRAES